jgi:hypothetical protein
VLYVELPRLGVLNASVFGLHTGIFEIGAGAQAECQAQNKNDFL